VGEQLEDWDVRDPEDRALLDRGLDGIARKLLDQEHARPEPVPA
jgi:hypothetical protein